MNKMVQFRLVWIQRAVTNCAISRTKISFFDLLTVNRTLTVNRNHSTMHILCAILVNSGKVTIWKNMVANGDVRKNMAAYGDCHVGTCKEHYVSRKMNTLQKMKFSIKDFFRKSDQIRRKLWIGHIYRRDL